MKLGDIVTISHWLKQYQASHIYISEFSWFYTHSGCFQFEDGRVVGPGGTIGCPSHDSDWLIL